MMKGEDKDRYKVILKNPNLQTPWSGIDYGTYLTMIGIEWCKFPRAKDEWFRPKEREQL